MKMPKFMFLIAIIVFAGGASVYGQINEEELQNLPPVVFINYVGPHTHVDTREEIRQIGVVLGNQIAANQSGIAPTLEAMTAEERRAFSYQFETGGRNRYFVIHDISAEENGRLNADVFGIGVDALVDHVRNLRVILQGYLQAAYNYSASDALLLAEFITIYNAVYRGNWDYFTNRYRTPVIGHLTSERAGLSIRFDEWPGRTLMLIPLGHGGLSSVDTGALSEMRVIEELRREEDMGIPQRQALVDLMEREADAAERQAQAERQEIRQEEAQIAEERREVAQERQEIQAERQQKQQEQQAGIITQEEAAQQQQEIAAREEAVDQREEDLARREDALEERREEAQRLEEFAEQRIEQAQEQREEIARDQQTAIIQVAAAVVQEATGGVFGITIERTSPVAMGRLVSLNPVNGREIRRSPMDSVHTRTVAIVGGRIFAIAGEEGGQAAVRLIEININTLEMTRQGNDNIRTGSLIWINGNDLYAITTDGSSCFLGRFNTNLELQARSSVSIHPDASVAINQGRLLTQRDNGSVLALNPSDLTEVQ